ncbi:transmembrane protein [Cystoisospora suis]|uniref:Transmembrane protein n=1 Tax=Cystoisospora suis TaxID=483139 RepID=A0A2C6L029_9APIC|nr:transmembrane protein [Cystoisospora suis]
MFSTSPPFHGPKRLLSRTACFFLGQLILLWIGPRLKLFPRTIGTLVFSSLTNLSLALIVVFLKNERIAFHICCVLSGLIGLQGSLLHASVYVLHAIIHHELAVDWSIGGGLAGPITAFLAFPLYFLLPGLTPQWSSRVRTVILFGFASLWSILSVTALALAVKNPFVSRALSQQEQMKSLFLLNRKKMKTKQSDPSSSSSSSSSPKRGLLLSLLFLHDRGKKKAYLEEQGRREREDGQHELLHEEDEEEEEERRKLRTDSRSSSLPNEDDDSDKSSRSSPRSMMLRRLGSHREEGEREGKQRRDDPYDSNGYSLLTGWRFRTFRRLPSALFERGKSFVLDIFHDPESRRNEGGNDRGGRRRSLQDDEEESSSSFLHHNDLDVREERRRERPIEEDLGERRSGANQDERKQEGSLEEEENEGTDQRQPLLVLSHEEESHDEERGREPQDRRDERKKKGIEEGEEETSLMNSKEKKFTSPCPCESSGRTLAYITDRQKKTETTRSDLEKFRYEEDHCITHHKRRWRRRDVMWNIRSNLLTCFLLFLSTYIVYPVKTERLMPSSNTQDFVLFQMILVACFQAGNVLGRFFVFWGCRAPFSCLLPLVSFRLLLIPFFFFLDGSLVLSPTATPAWMKPDDALWLSRDPANEATTSSHTFLHDQLSSSSSSSLHNALDREKLPQRAPEDFSPPSSSSSRLYGNHPLLHPHHRHSQHILASPLTSPSSPPEASLHDIQLQHRHNGTSPLSSPPPSDLYLFPDLFSQQPQDSSGFLALLFPFGDVTALELRGILSDLSLFLLMMVFSTLHGWLSVLGAYYATQVPSSSAQKETAAYLMCLAESCGVALGAGLSIIWASLTGCHPLSPHHHHGYRPAGIGSASTPSPSLSSSTPFSSSSLSSSSSSSFMGRPTASYHEMTSLQSVGDSLSFSPWLSAPMSRVEGRRRSDMFSLHPFLLEHGIAATSSSSSFHAGMARVGRAGGQTGPLLASSSSPPPLQHVPKIG